MWERLRESFNNLNRGKKSFILYFYFSAMAFFMIVWVFNFDIIELSIVIGLLSAIVIEPLLETSEKGNKAKDFLFKFLFARKVIFSVVICFFCVLLRFLINQVFSGYEFEPISFGILFAGTHALFSYCIKFLFGLRRTVHEK